MKALLAVASDGAELFIDAPTHFHSCWFGYPRPFSGEWQREIIIIIPKKDTRLECDNWKSMCELSADPKIILKRMKELLQGLTDK